MTDLDTLFADPRTPAVLRRAIEAGYDPELPVRALVEASA